MQKLRTFLGGPVIKNLCSLPLQGAWNSQSLVEDLIPHAVSDQNVQS